VRCHSSEEDDKNKLLERTAGLRPKRKEGNLEKYDHFNA
jgi:hypothetical protein